jgi:hypothetical protein
VIENQAQSIPVRAASSPPATWRRLAFAGAVAVGAAVAAGDLVAGVLGAPSPLLEVDRSIVDMQPPAA